jgi:hypothetical protein
MTATKARERTAKKTAAKKGGAKKEPVVGLPELVEQVSQDLIEREDVNGSRPFIEANWEYIKQMQRAGATKKQIWEAMSRAGYPVGVYTFFSRATKAVAATEEKAEHMMAKLIQQRFGSSLPHENTTTGQRSAAEIAREGL